MAGASAMREEAEAVERAGRSSRQLETTERSGATRRPAKTTKRLSVDELVAFMR